MNCLRKMFSRALEQLTNNVYNFNGFRGKRKSKESINILIVQIPLHLIQTHFLDFAVLSDHCLLPFKNETRRTLSILLESNCSCEFLLSRIKSNSNSSINIKFV